LDTFIRSEDGQSIPEYGMVIAFVAVLVVLCFTTNGGLKQALSGAFSAMSQQVMSLARQGS
jgi:Flp pilus assembly pilin Flp